MKTKTKPSPPQKWENEERKRDMVCCRNERLQKNQIKRQTGINGSEPVGSDNKFSLTANVKARRGKYQK